MQALAPRHGASKLGVPLESFELPRSPRGKVKVTMTTPTSMEPSVEDFRNPKPRTHIFTMLFVM